MEEKERLAKVEGIVSQISERLNHVETRLNHLGEKIDEKIDELRKESATNFRWIVGIILFTWVSSLATFISLFLRLK